MPPPLDKDFLFESIWANKHATAVLEHLIGPKPQLTFASTNVVLPSLDIEARQAVHCDAFAELHDFPVGIQVFLYLDDVSKSNGVTEFWPGSHKDWGMSDFVTHGRGWIKPSTFKKRAKICAPVQPYIRRGSICLRDIRLWHAGMANPSGDPIIMLGFMYYPSWFRSQMRVTLPEDCRDIVKSWGHVDALCATKFLEGKVDYLGWFFENFWRLNFTQDPGRKWIGAKAGCLMSRF